MCFTTQLFQWFCIWIVTNEYYWSVQFHLWGCWELLKGLCTLWLFGDWVSDVLVLFLFLFVLFAVFEIVEDFTNTIALALTDPINLIQTNKHRFFISPYSIIPSQSLQFLNKIISRPIIRGIDFNYLIFVMFGQYTHQGGFAAAGGAG